MRGNINQMDADEVCRAVEAADDQMAQMALNDLPQDDVYDDEEDDSEVAGGKKKRGWMSKVGKGLYRRAGSLAKTVGLVDAPASKEDEDIRATMMTCRLPTAAANGGVAIQNPEHAKVCRSVLSLMISQMGRNLLKGGAVMNVSFPIQCCQPKTILEIGSLMGGFTHLYLPRAAASSDPVERMKNVVSCFVSAMTLTCGNFLKPLNPILGETLQVDYGDGSKLYMEQTCHHPPVSAFYLVAGSKDYTVSGHQTFNVNFGYNKMFITNKGVRVVTFKDGGSISLDFAPDRWLNVFWGEMVHESVGPQLFWDEKNKIRCRLNYGAEGRKNVPTDYFEGVIERYDPANPEAEGQVVSNVEGSWVGYCDFDKVRYWDHRTTEKLAMSPPRNTLPSDSRRRADRNALEKKDFKLAQTEKVRMEEQQRAERKLRENVHGKH
mmetsp:Transcript_89282/g.133859  ORF Transcript_89282/g.133859 Transcript_89282/m.133859 type:complete len:435 (-) Transcript_89282:168-1472(-)